MLKKLLYCSLLVGVSLFAYDSSVYAMEEQKPNRITRKSQDIDPEKIIDHPVQTRNNKGLNYNTLGSFEEAFLEDCWEIEFNGEVGNILCKGEAFGRLPIRIVSQAPTSSLTTIYVNELDGENMQPLVQKIVRMKLGSNTKDKAAASRMRLIVGDCLELPENRKFKGFFNNDDPENCFDLIMCSNVLHFFDAEQVLKFFINTFNFLKPGGKAYIFTASRIEDYSPEEIIRSKQISPIYQKACFGVMEAAKEDSSILFPGLMHDEWLLKTAVLRYIIGEKPNGLDISNVIPGTTLQLIADKLGFEVVSQKFYTLFSDTPGGVAKMEEKEDGLHCGLILKKPKSYAGGSVTMKTLDQTFVESCLAAKDQMKTFIDTQLDFPAGYPFVQKKK